MVYFCWKTKLRDELFTYTQTYTPTVVQGGRGRVVVTPPLGFWEYLGNISLLTDSLSCDVQDKVNIMGYDIVGVRDVIQNGRHLGFY